MFRKGAGVPTDVSPEREMRTRIRRIKMDKNDRASAGRCGWWPNLALLSFTLFILFYPFYSLLSLLSV